MDSQVDLLRVREESLRRNRLFLQSLGFLDENENNEDGICGDVDSGGSDDFAEAKEAETTSSSTATRQTKREDLKSRQRHERTQIEELKAEYLFRDKEIEFIYNYYSEQEHATMPMGPLIVYGGPGCGKMTILRQVFRILSHSADLSKTSHTAAGSLSSFQAINSPLKSPVSSLLHAFAMPNFPLPHCFAYLSCVNHTSSKSFFVESWKTILTAIFQYSKRANKHKVKAKSTTSSFSTFKSHSTQKQTRVSMFLSLLEKLKEPRHFHEFAQNLAIVNNNIVRIDGNDNEDNNKDVDDNDAGGDSGGFFGNKKKRDVGWKLHLVIHRFDFLNNFEKDLSCHILQLCQENVLLTTTSYTAMYHHQHQQQHSQRFSFQYHFQPYTRSELMQIILKNIQQRDCSAYNNNNNNNNNNGLSFDMLLNSGSTIDVLRMYSTSVSVISRMAVALMALVTSTKPGVSTSSNNNNNNSSDIVDAHLQVAGPLVAPKHMTSHIKACCQQLLFDYSGVYIRNSHEIPNFNKDSDINNNIINNNNNNNNKQWLVDIPLISKYLILAIFVINNNSNKSDIEKFGLMNKGRRKQTRSGATTTGGSKKKSKKEGQGDNGVEDDGGEESNVDAQQSSSTPSNQQEQQQQQHLRHQHFFSLERLFAVFSQIIISNQGNNACHFNISELTSHSIVTQQQHANNNSSSSSMQRQLSKNEAISDILTTYGTCQLFAAVKSLLKNKLLFLLNHSVDISAGTDMHSHSGSIGVLSVINEDDAWLLQARFTGLVPATLAHSIAENVGFPLNAFLIE